MHPDKRRIIPVVLVLAALAALGYWYIEVRPAQAASAELSASGTIEVTQVQIGAEVGGKVVAVKVDEGDTVKAGDTLVQIDVSLLQAQREQAAANLEVAKANSLAAQSAAQQAQADLSAAQLKFDTAKSTQTAQRQAETSAARLALLQAQNALTDLQQNAETVTANAQLTLVKAQKTYTDTLNARNNLDYITNSQLAKDARQALENADGLVKRLRKIYQSLPGSNSTNPVKAKAFFMLQMARLRRDMAQRAADQFGEPSAYDLAKADANLALAKAQMELAQVKLDEVKDGISEQDQALAEERVANAQATLDLINAQPATQQVDLAQEALNSAKERATAAQSQAVAAKAQVSVAQAALDTLDVQLGKLTIVSPADGVVLTRAIQPGEIALPSATLLELGLVDKRTITVYVPEERYGEISIGQEAAVSVDSFPGASFKAVVTTISDQAEFTPRNVQTVEGRKNTVFAIHLQIVEPDNRLKSGMPADVVFK
jgi:multidrug resistance efflux pump